MKNQTSAAVIADILPKKQAQYSVYNSRLADKFVVRYPDGMRDKIAEIAKDHHRSMNSEIISCLSLHIKLTDMGMGQYLTDLSRGLTDQRSLSELAPELVQQAPAALAAPASLRAGDPVMHDGSPWIIAKLTARGGNVYAKIERENPADASKTDDTEVRYSALTPFQA